MKLADVSAAALRSLSRLVVVAGAAPSWRGRRLAAGAAAGTQDVRYLKVAVASRFPRVLDEGARMRWARRYLPVPKVLECASDGQVDWLG